MEEKITKLIEQINVLYTEQKISEQARYEIVIRVSF